MFLVLIFKYYYYCNAIDCDHRSNRFVNSNFLSKFSVSVDGQDSKKIAKKGRLLRGEFVDIIFNMWHEHKYERLLPFSRYRKIFQFEKIKKFPIDGSVLHFSSFHFISHCIGIWKEYFDLTTKDLLWKLYAIQTIYSDYLFVWLVFVPKDL